MRIHDISSCTNTHSLVWKLYINLIIILLRVRHAHIENGYSVNKVITARNGVIVFDR